MKPSRRTSDNWFVYILLCGNNSFYVGTTSNIKRRFSEHKEGKGGKYTSSHRPLQLVYFESLTSMESALKREKQLKGWSRKKKIDLINKFTCRGSSVVRAESS